MTDDRLIIAGREFKSRLWVGTGKYKDFTETKKAIEVSGADVVTVGTSGEASGFTSPKLILDTNVWLDWLLFDERGRFRWRHALYWLAFPLGYLAFVRLSGVTRDLGWERPGIAPRHPPLGPGPPGRPSRPGRTTPSVGRASSCTPWQSPPSPPLPAAASPRCVLCGKFLSYGVRLTLIPLGGWPFASGCAQGKASCGRMAGMPCITVPEAAVFREMLSRVEASLLAGSILCVGYPATSKKKSCRSFAGAAATRPRPSAW